MIAFQLFGIDNISGKQHYVTNLPNFGEFSNGQPMKITVQRTSKHFPHPARCIILAKHTVICFLDFTKYSIDNL